MPILPSGRRIEFSLDRFHSMLWLMSRSQAKALVAMLEEPDDLLFFMDAVYFGREDGAPFLAGCIASDWATYAADWSTADREALLAWFASDEARERRTEAIDYIKALVFDGPSRVLAYPYLVLNNDGLRAAEGSRLLQ